MAITVRFPKVVALDGFAVQTAVPADARITEVDLGGGAKLYDVTQAGGADLALLGVIDLPNLMERSPISQASGDWLVLRVAMLDEDGTPAAAQVDVGALLDDAPAATIQQLSAAATGVALGPPGGAALSRDNIAVYQGNVLLVAEGAAGGPWDVMVTAIPMPTIADKAPIGLLGAAPA